jgi:hypothetical protein
MNLTNEKTLDDEPSDPYGKPYPRRVEEND